MKKLKVSSIRPIGRQSTFNLHMKGEQHNFALANGVISGNSHAVAYSIVTYWTAWLKAHYPVHFYAALLTHEDDEDRIIQYVCAAREAGIKILPPDINRSSLHHKPEGNSIRYGLGLIKGIPRAEVERIIALRDGLDQTV